MKKFLLRFLLISGALAGIAYWKKDQILDVLIQHSIDVDRINGSVDNVIDKAEIVKQKISEAKQTLNNSKDVIQSFEDDITKYSTDIQPLVENIKNKLKDK
ncbi:hypothetical protein [Ligilactobacillus araffinosus]|uniref:Uncharacterized protein n=1 Tax=Ligilactobacillus araffinosus DSM 20653 TaxID=1423820 RepID=A0A0R1ZK82_9LACO|nr:hypothetical protein [Ligilactobacillus araffinosus]KRM53348.1 hypothetical protein FC64_GL000632 [Ligilactobacillus araffinosus DSM 20653]